MRRLPSIFSRLSQSFSSSSSSSSSTPGEIPILYSFLQPTVFPLKNRSPFANSPPVEISQISTPPQFQISSANQDALGSNLEASLKNNQTDEAWKSFKSLASGSSLPSRQACNSLISHLTSLRDLHNLKRAFASAIFLLEKSPKLLSFDTLEGIFRSLDAAPPAFALIRSMLKSRCFAPYHVWGGYLLQLARNSGDLDKFILVLEENSKIALKEKIPSMNPDFRACNEILAACCRESGSVPDAEHVVRIMSAMNMHLDGESFGALAYVYAWRGLKNRIIELERIISDICIKNKSTIYCNLIRGYLRSGNLDSTMEIILQAVKDQEPSSLDEETYSETAKFFVEKGRIKDLARLIIESKPLNSSSAGSFGDGVVNACVNQGMVDKAHSILDEMTAGGAASLGAYSAVLRAYCKEKRTAEAAELAAEASAAGLRLDAASFDAMIDASMSCQDFQSALSLFRDMREAQNLELKQSYLTIMTGLMESQRPELMAGFLDSVVDDPRVEIATHDWNSIIHAFCKAGKLDDARRTYRRMVFLQFEPSEQTFLSLINGYVSAEKYFGVVVLWSEVRRKGTKLGHASLDGFIYALVKGGFFEAAMQVVEKAKEMKVFVDKWRHKQAFMENHKKLRISQLRRRNFRKMEALIAFKAWAGLAT